MYIYYSTPSNARPITKHSHPALPTEQGGQILTDSILLNLWRHADGKMLDEIIATFQATDISPIEIKAALVCLAEAGLLNRQSPISTETPNDNVNKYS